MSQVCTSRKEEYALVRLPQKTCVGVQSRLRKGNLINMNGSLE